MIADVHTHVWQTPGELGPAIERRLLRGERKPWDRFATGISALTRALGDVDLALVHGLHSQHAHVHITHEQVAAAVTQQPHKLLGIAGIDPLAPAPLESIDRAVSLGLVGVALCPAGQAMHPAHSRAMSVYERCTALKLPVFIHNSDLYGDVAAMEFARPELFDEVARAFPALPIVLAGVARPWGEVALDLVGRHANLYADLTGYVAEPWPLFNVLLAAHQRGVCEKLLFASGFPFCEPHEAIVNIYSVNRFTHESALPRVPRTVLRGLVERDVCAALGIALPGTRPPTVTALAATPTMEHAS